MSESPKPMGPPRRYPPGSRVTVNSQFDVTLLARIDAARGAATRSAWLAEAAEEKLKREKGKGGE